nr:hypothetical protein [Nocardia sp. SYP-A9097]
MREWQSQQIGIYSADSSHRSGGAEASPQQSHARVDRDDLVPQFCKEPSVSTTPRAQIDNDRITSQKLGEHQQVLFEPIEQLEGISSLDVAS